MYQPAIFPHLLDYVLVAPLILRVFVALFIGSLVIDKFKKKFDIILIFYIATFVLLLLGLFTQIATILGILILKLDFYTKYWSKRASEDISRNTYFLYALAGAILISLLTTGPGFWAFDLPF